MIQGNLLASLSDAHPNLELDTAAATGPMAESQPEGAMNAFASAMTGIGPVVGETDETRSDFPIGSYQTDESGNFAAALGGISQTESLSSTSATEVEDRSHLPDLSPTTLPAIEASVYDAQAAKDAQETLMVRAMLEQHKAELLEKIAQGRAALQSTTAFTAEEKAARAREVKPGVYDITFILALIKSVTENTISTWAGDPNRPETWSSAFNRKRKRKDENSFAAVAG
jgi:hypothetical protein